MRRTIVIAAIVAMAAIAAVIAIRARRGPPPTPERLAALTRERDALEERWRAALLASGEGSLAHGPEADLVIGLPAALTASILGQVVTGAFGQATLTVRDMHVRKGGEVSARILIARRTIGAYLVDVKIDSVRGMLSAGVPALSFGQDKVDVIVPVRLLGGEGDAELRLEWNGRGVSGFVCDDFDVTRTFTAGLVPQDYELRGSFAISAEGETIVLQPGFPDLKVRVGVAPSAEAWAVVDALIRDQPRGCEIALDLIDVKERISTLLGEGFDVAIPQKILAPVRLPAAVRRSVRLMGVDLGLQVTPTAVTAAGDRMWYGADVTVGRTHPR